MNYHYIHAKVTAVHDAQRQSFLLITLALNLLLTGLDVAFNLVSELSQVVDAKKASYGVENATYAVVQLAQTTMRSELGKITLDKTFEERATLNLNIVESIRYVTIAPMLHLFTCYICPYVAFAHSSCTGTASLQRDSLI